MKQRIIIKGPKIHDVGYRYFLMTMARRARIRYFDADNIDDAVEVLIESDEKKITAFKKLIETLRPERAEVSEISYEDYDGEIWPISEYSQFCTNLQMNKAIPILLDIVEVLRDVKDDTSSMLEKQDETIGILRDVKEDTSSMTEKQDETIEILSDMDEKADQSLVRQDETTEAVKNLKLDDSRLARIESDIKDIKTKIGAR